MLILRAQRYYISFLNLKFKMYRFFEAQYFVFQDFVLTFALIFFSCSKKTRKKDAAAIGVKDTYSFYFQRT
jgi:hypothetical protein